MVLSLLSSPVARGSGWFYLFGVHPPTTYIIGLLLFATAGVCIAIDLFEMRTRVVGVNLRSPKRRVAEQLLYLSEVGTLLQ